MNRKAQISIVLALILTWAPCLPAQITVYDTTSLADAPQPLPGTHPAVYLTDQALINGDWQARVSPGAVVLLNMEESQHWYGDQPHAPNLIREMRAMYPTAKLAVYPLGGTGFNIDNPDKIADRQQRNNRRATLLACLGEDITFIVPELYCNFGLHKNDWQRRYWQSQLDEAKRVAGGSVKIAPIVSATYYVTNDKWRFGAPLDNETWQTLLSVLQENQIEHVFLWFGWAKASEIKKGLKWPVADDDALRQALGMQEASNPHWWQHRYGTRFEKMVQQLVEVAADD